MKNCPNCKIMVQGHLMHCPLCQNALKGNGTPSPFPLIVIPRSHKLFFRLLIFLSIAAALVCVVVNSALPHTGAWSVFVVAGVACLWISLGIALHKRRDLLKNIAWQSVVLSALAIIWDVGTNWHRWSVNYVVPCIFIVTMLLTPLLARLLKMPRHSYFVYFFLVFCFGLIPIAFLALKWVTVPLPSFLSVGFSAVSLLAMLVFSGKSMGRELHRRFHI